MAKQCFRGSLSGTSSHTRDGDGLNTIELQTKVFVDHGGSDGRSGVC